MPGLEYYMVCRDWSREFEDWTRIEDGMLRLVSRVWRLNWATHKKVCRDWSRFWGLNWDTRWYVEIEVDIEDWIGILDGM